MDSIQDLDPSGVVRLYCVLRTRSQQSPATQHSPSPELHYAVENALIASVGRPFATTEGRRLAMAPAMARLLFSRSRTYSRYCGSKERTSCRLARLLCTELWMGKSGHGIWGVCKSLAWCNLVGKIRSSLLNGASMSNSLTLNVTSAVVRSYYHRWEEPKAERILRT